MTGGSASASASSYNGNATATATSVYSSAYATAYAFGTANATAVAYGLSLSNQTNNGTATASVTSSTFSSSMTVHQLATFPSAHMVISGGTFTADSTISDGNVSLTGGSASLGSISGNGTISVANGTSLSASGISMHSGTLTVNGNVTLSSTSATRQTSAVTLDVGTMTVGTSGLLDLANHDLIIYGGETLSQVEALIAAAYNSGSWTGTHGITSSTVAAASDKALGYATAGEIAISTFDGISVSLTDILVKYTWQGDYNLDGKVDLTDLNIANNNLGTSGDWAHGDSNYDGSVNLNDINAVNNHLGDGSSSPLVIIADSGSSAPEPASLAVLGLGTTGLTVRRKRR